MALIGTLVKVVGAAAVDSAIDTACQNLDKFVQSIRFNRNFKWRYTFFGKGKLTVDIEIGIRKTRNRVYFDLPGQRFDFSVDLTGSVENGCKTAIASALTLT